jgi:hypothetical protein
MLLPSNSEIIITGVILAALSLTRGAAIAKNPMMQTN